MPTLPITEGAELPCNENVASAPTVSSSEVRHGAGCSRNGSRMLCDCQFTPSLAKLSIHLLETSDNWLTPWHGAAVDVGGRFVLMKQCQAEAMGADLIYVDGRPSHYMARAADVPGALIKSGGRR
jgi:hypothetical protein